MKICKNCKHYREYVHTHDHDYKNYNRCVRDAGPGKTNLINGFHHPDPGKSCKKERGFLSRFLKGRCGKEGRYYEEKES